MITPTFLSLSAFHILKDTTIQFTLEKVPPIDEDTQFTFLTTDEPYNSTGLLRVEGKFVNAVQVYFAQFCDLLLISNAFSLRL